MTFNGEFAPGGVNDEVSLTIAGKEIAICESYEIKVSVMTQPAAFSLRLGHGGVAKELIELCPKGAEFQLKIGGVLIQSGIVDGRSIPSSDSTVVEIRGRDYMRALVNGHVEEDVSLTEKTYYDLTRKVMNLCGLDKHELIAGNGANRQAVTATAVPIVAKESSVVEQTETGVGSVVGSKMVFQALKAKVGQRWYDWLQDKYRLVGLFLWCTGDGKFVLATPQPNVEPSFVLVRQRGVPRNTVNIVSHSWRDDAAGRHAQYIVYGRNGAGKGGRAKVKGEFVDVEMAAAGFSDVITFHETDVATQKDAEYLARRYAAEARRAGWELVYTVAGHSTPSLIADGAAVWGVDTTAKVIDDEIGINGPHYIESVTFARKPQTETRIELIRPEDLLYLAEQNPEQKKAASKALAAAKAATPAPVATTEAATETDWTKWSWERDGDAATQAKNDESDPFAKYQS